MEDFNLERVFLAAQCIGIGEAAYEAARDYARSRRQFGRPIADFQAVRHQLVDMYVLLEQARLLFYQACAEYGDGARRVLAASMAKLAASEMINRVTSMAVQIHGGYGYVTDYPVERYYRGRAGCTPSAGARRRFRGKSSRGGWSCSQQPATPDEPEKEGFRRRRNSEEESVERCGKGVERG